MTNRKPLSSLNPLSSLCLSLPLLALSFSTGCIIERGDKTPAENDDSSQSTPSSSATNWSGSASGTVSASTGSGSATASVTTTPSGPQNPSTSMGAKSSTSSSTPSSDGVSNNSSSSTDSSSSSSDSSSSDTDTSTQAPSSLNLKLKVEGEKKGLTPWRVRFNYLNGSSNKTVGTMLDLELSRVGEEFVVDLPAPSKSKLSKGRVYIVANVYADRDKSDSFSRGDTYVAALPVSIRYTRPAAGVTEWQQDKSGELSVIKDTLILKRVDGVPATPPTIKIGGKMADVLEGTNGVASVAASEYDGKTKKPGALRGIEGRLPEGSADAWSMEFTRRLYNQRLTGSKIPGIGTHGFEYLIGFYNKHGNLFRPGFSEVTSGLCTKDKTPVGGLYITPGRDWIKDPVGAHMVASMGIRPGWNIVNVELDVDAKGGDRLRVLNKDERNGLLISADCLIKK